MEQPLHVFPSHTRCTKCLYQHVINPGLLNPRVYPGRPANCSPRRHDIKSISHRSIPASAFKRIHTTYIRETLSTNASSPEPCPSIRATQCGTNVTRAEWSAVTLSKCRLTTHAIFVMPHIGGDKHLELRVTETRISRFG